MVEHGPKFSPREGLDLLGLHIADMRKYKFDREKNKTYGRDIFKGQISLLQLEQLLTSGLLNPSQAEQTQKILQAPKAAFLVEEFKGIINNKRTSETMQKVHGRFLRRVALNQEFFERRLARVDQEGGSSKEAQIQEIIESRIAIYDRSSLAFDNLVLTNLQFAFSIAKRYQNQGLEIEDLIGHSYGGLLKAAARFDYRSGFTFTTYATHWVRQTTSRAIADYGNPIRIPVHLGEKGRDVSQMRNRLMLELGRNPTSKELSEALGPGYELAESAFRLRNIDSLNRRIGEDGETELGDLVVDTKPEHLEFAFDIEKREKISEALAHISPRERQVIEMRFGLNGTGPMTLKEVGKVIGVTRERIRQIEARALKKLRRPEISEHLRPLFLET